MTLGQNLIKQRKARHLSQQGMAEKLHIERTTYNRWERDISCPSLDMIKQLAIEFGTTLDELCDFVSKPENKVEPVDEAKVRLQEMGINTVFNAVSIVISIDGLEYGIDKRDLPELVKSADTRYKKLIDSISKGMYQSALTMVLNSGIIDVSQQYGKSLVNEIEVKLFDWLNKYDEKLTPGVLAEITKEWLIKLPIRTRESVWEQLIYDLVISNTIDPDQYELEKEKWKCPSYKAHGK